MDDRQRRIARARLLRRQGKTYDEIRAALDAQVSDDTFQYWLKGIARPPETLRGRARDELRQECRRLRAQGYSYSQIAAMTGASKGSISPWVHDVVIPPGLLRHLRVERIQEARRRTGKALSERVARRRDAIRSGAATTLIDIDDRDLFIAGLALYWAEGSKDKPWRRNGRVVLINSDPTVLATFLAWLALVGVRKSELRYRLTIHETADVAAHERWWADTLQVPLALFGRATLKKHNPKTVRLNTGDDYHGCLVVTVTRSSALYYAIEGWWNALSEGARARSIVHTGSADGPP